MKQQNLNVLYEQNDVINSVKTKKSIYDFGCDYSLLTFKASKECSIVLSKVYESCTMKRSIQIGTTERLRSLDAMLENATESDNKKLIAQLQEIYSSYAIKNMIAQSLYNQQIRKYHKPLIEQTYKAYCESFNDISQFKKALKEWALKELSQKLDDSVVNWLCKLVGVKVNNVSRFNKSLLKFLNEQEYAKIIIFALTELALHKQQLSIKRMKDDIIDLNVLYNTKLQHIHAIIEPQNPTKKWYLGVFNVYNLSTKTKDELKSMTKDELKKELKKEVAKRPNLRFKQA